jgi:(E)-4-hydroxy-3-methylbut-2-enyl-diphosphate synthase
MILAYRLLVAEMMVLGWDYPLHLGLTEAGEGEDGRIKSAMGIGSLLLDGIGDTIRVSLTEDAWNEIDPCKRLVAFANAYEGKGVDPFEEKHRIIELIQRRSVILPKNMALHRDGTVILNVHSNDLESPDFYKKLGCDVQLGLPKLKASSADCIVIAKKPMTSRVVQTLQDLRNIGVSVLSPGINEGDISLLTLEKARSAYVHRSNQERFSISPSPKTPMAVIVRDEPDSQWEIIEEIKPTLIFLSPSINRLHYCRKFFDWLQTQKIQIPVIINFEYECSKEDLIIQSAAEYGVLLCDGLGDGICIDAPYDIEFLRNLSFNILQSARMRTFKTDFISCPSCGRTFFDLQDVSKRICSRTSHLPGVKIAIMGCIVNGPGEMADADFGYVGSKPGMIDLYVGEECIEKDINFADADDRLVELIRKHGRWIEPEIATETTLTTIP